MARRITKSKPIIRSYELTDLGAVLGVDAALPRPMGRDAMRGLLDDIQYGKIVMTIDRKVVGYLVYGWRRLSFVVVRFGILPAFRRRRIGRTAFRWLAGAARSGGRTMVEVWVPDWAVDAQVFLVRHKYVGMSDGDQIVFRIGLHGK